MMIYIVRNIKIFDKVACNTRVNAYICAIQNDDQHHILYLNALIFYCMHSRVRHIIRDTAAMPQDCLLCDCASCISRTFEVVVFREWLCSHHFQNFDARMLHTDAAARHQLRL